MHRTTRATATAVLLLAALTACTSSSDSPSTQPNTHPAKTKAKGNASAAPADSSRDDLEAAVRAYSAAYFRPDPTAAYSMMSKRCAAKADPVVYAAIVREGVKGYGHQAIKSLTVDQVSGDLGRVSYTYSVPKLSQSGQPWAREGGRWLYDAC